MCSILTYLEIDFIQDRDGRHVVAFEDVLSHCPSLLDALALVLGAHVGLLAEILSGLWVAFHGQVVQDKSVDVADVHVSQIPATAMREILVMCARYQVLRKKQIVFSAWVSRRDSH